MSDEELLFTFGKHAVLSRKGDFVLVHLDHPTPELLLRRTEDFDPDVFFHAGCGMCQMLRETRVVVFDDTIFEDEEAMLD